jgi:N-acetyl-anhydromuramyl-L-alanine amidase AmpD
MTKNQPQAIVVHHTAVSRSKNQNQFAAVKKYHIEQGWGDIGYHYFIEVDGTLKPGRTEETVGTHCKEEDMNFKSVGICLTGFFDTEDPTAEQLATLTKLIGEIRTKYKIPADKVYPHRKFASYKSCPGTRFTDELLAKVANTKEVETAKKAPACDIPEWSREAVAWAAKANIITKATGEPISDYRLAVILKNFADSMKS